MRERVLAILGAVALVAVALLVRSWVAGGSGDDGGGGGGPGSGGRPVVACTPDLRTICEALADDGRIAEDPPTFDLTDEEVPPEIDAWITWDPAPRIMNENAGQMTTVWADGEPMGSARLGLLLTTVDRDELGESCDWACVADRVDDDWPIGIGDPTSAWGLARWRPVAQALADEEEGRYASISPSRIGAILDSPADGQESVTLTRFLSAPGLARTYVDLLANFEGAPSSRNLTPHDPEPDTDATVILVARDGNDSADLATDLAGEALDQALADAGVTPGGTLVPADEAVGLWHIWDKAG